MSIIFTAEGWKQLRPRRNDIIQPARVAPLRADGRYITLQDPLDYDDQGRYLHDPKVWRKGELEAFRKLLMENSNTSGRGGYAGEPRPPGRYDRWGVRVMS